MVDLDSNPTKLIEVVEVGKQMLVTRGALTTFSIANDVAKYFAIIPAAFATTYPALDALNLMRLASPAERDPVGRHLQRADHRGAGAARAARRQDARRVRRGAAASEPADLRRSAGSSCRSSGSSSSTCCWPRWCLDREEDRCARVPSSRARRVRAAHAADRGRLSAGDHRRSARGVSRTRRAAASSSATAASSARRCWDSRSRARSTSGAGRRRPGRSRTTAPPRAVATRAR